MDYKQKQDRVRSQKLVKFVVEKEIRGIRG